MLWGLKFAYSHRNWRSPLTLSELPLRLMFTYLWDLYYNWHFKTSRRRRIRGKQLKETQGTPRTRTHTSFILAKFCIWWGPWLIAGSLSLTPLTVWPLAGLQMRARVSTTMQPKVFLCWMLFLPQPFLFLGLGTGSEYTGLHTVRLGWYCSVVLFIIDLALAIAIVSNK